LIHCEGILVQKTQNDEKNIHSDGRVKHVLFARSVKFHYYEKSTGISHSGPGTHHGFHGINKAEGGALDV